MNSPVEPFNKRPSPLYPVSSNNKNKNAHVNKLVAYAGLLALVFATVAIFISVFYKEEKLTTTQAAQAQASATQITATTLKSVVPNLGNSSNVNLQLEEDLVIAAIQKIIPSSVTIETDGGNFGSGFFYDNSGLIMTAAHVVVDSAGNVAQSVTVGITRGSSISYRVPGTVVGVDKTRDVAVVKANINDLGFEITIAELAKLPVRLGQTLLAIGSPFRLENTVTKGIVSQVNRTVIGDGVALGLNLIQTDTPINSGNSGGALVNLSGEVVGINILIQSVPSENGQGGNVGVGFAVPIKQAQEVVARIVRGDTETGLASLGITGRNSTLGRSGALVVDVVSGEAAHGAGIRVGDLIVKADGGAINSFSVLLAAIQLRRPGDTIKLDIIRTNENNVEEELSITLTLGLKAFESAQAN